MVQRYYIDTAIWRDLHENRTDRFRPIGEWAFELIKKIIEKREEVLYSELIITELSKDFTKEDIEEIFSSVSKEGIMKRVETTESQIREANILRRKLKIPFGDIVHAIVTRDNNAVLVTRDHHFEALTDIAVIKKPEDLI